VLRRPVPIITELLDRSPAAFLSTLPPGSSEQEQLRHRLHQHFWNQQQLPVVDG